MRRKHWELDQLIKHLRQLGWSCQRTVRGHMRLLPPHGGKLYIAPRKVGEYHGVANLVSLIRRQEGLDL